MKTTILDLKLQTIRDFQAQYPDSHIGGSIGLYLLGYDIKRDFNSSDIDLICPSFNAAEHVKNANGNVSETSETNDFNFNYRRDFGAFYVKYDICINTEQEFQVVEHDGKKYNVSLFENIMKFKRAYAEKGYSKHKDDIIAIETGVRPDSYFEELQDNLPF